jgi:hypothetical protein
MKVSVKTSILKWEIIVILWKELLPFISMIFVGRVFPRDGSSSWGSKRSMQQQEAKPSAVARRPMFLIATASLAARPQALAHFMPKRWSANFGNFLFRASLRAVFGGHSCRGLPGGGKRTI